MKKPSMIFFLNVPKKNSKTGKIPIYLRIIFNRQKKEIRLNCDIDEDQLSSWDSKTMRFNSRGNSFNSYLSRLESRLNDFLILNNFQVNSYDAGKIMDYILEKRPKLERTVLEFVNDYFESVVSPNREFSAGTKKNYRKSINHLSHFLTYTKAKSMLLVDFGPSMAAKFKDYLVNDIPKIKKVGMAEVSAAAVIKKLKPMFERATWDELITKNPFRGLRLKNKSPLKARLNIQQVKKIKDLDLSNFPFMSVHRDIFLFSVFTGLAYGDAMKLQNHQVLEVENGNRCIRIDRAKTQITTQVVMVKYVENIVEAFRANKTVITKNVLPQRSNKELNVNLKFIAEKAEIPIKLTSHIARHTFRQLLGEAGITDQSIIKRMMGQRKSGDMDEIYYSVTSNQLIEAKDKFQAFLEKHLD